MSEWARSRQQLEELRAVLGDGPWTLSELREVGWGYERVRAAVKAGRFVRIRRGQFAASPAAARWDLCRAAVRSATGHVALSHPTAGDVHELWVPKRWDDQLIHLTASGGVDRRTPGVRVHGSRLLPSAITLIDGLPVTTPARTALDLARGGSLEDAVMVTDSAARCIIRGMGYDLLALRDPEQRQELASLAQDELRDAFRDVWTWPGTVVARAAIDLLDPASESPAESRSRAWIITAKLPVPAIAFAVRGASGRLYFSDFAWPKKRLLGEVDGFGKYGETAEQVRARLRAERRRHDDLVDAGWRVVRWSSADREREVVQRLRRVLAE